MSIAVNTGSARGASIAAPLVGTPIVQAAPTPADKPAAGTQPMAHRFAELLRRNRAEAPNPTTPVPVHAPRADGSGDGAGSGDAAAIEAKAAPANAAKARASTAKETTGKATVDESEDRDDKGDAAGDDDCTDESERSERSERAERPAATMSPVDRLDSRPLAPAAIDALRRLASASAGPIDDAAASAGDGRDAPAGTATKYGLGHAPGMASIDSADDRHASALDASRDLAVRLGADVRFQVTPGESIASSDSPAAMRSHERAIDALTASLGVGAPSAGAGAAIAPDAPTALALSAAVDAPDFAAELGVRVSLLVQDGVQRAELHLNPAETGPVSVHITVDGSSARVDFGADLAATRAAIERGLPELASALREAGFTLAGGGVSQHAGGRASDDAGTGRSTPRVDAGAGAVPTPIAADARTVIGAVGAGGVDLYA